MDWVNFHFEEAKLVSSRSLDLSSKVGAIVVDNDHQQLSRGWNGVVRKAKTITENNCHREVKYEYIVHSEMNCIYNAARRGISLINSSFYIYGIPPCLECAKAIIQVGARSVFSMCTSSISDKWKLSYEKSKALFTEVGIESNILYF